MTTYLKYMPLVLAVAGLVLPGYFVYGEDPEQPPARDLQTNRRNFDLGLSALVKLRDAQHPETVMEAPESPEGPGSEGDAEHASEKEEGDSSAVSESAPPVLKYRRLPLHTGSVRAPRPVRPSANPMEQMNRRALQDAITRPLEFGAPSLGFQPPDWTEPLRDIEADSMVTDLNTSETILKDNVRMRSNTRRTRGITRPQVMCGCSSMSPT